MWLGVDPAEMCRKHLLGEHVELHMLAGCLSQNKNIASVVGLAKAGFIDICSRSWRHEEISEEMLRRGMCHKSKLNLLNLATLPLEACQVIIDTNRSRLDLAARCPECAARMKKEA
jgi:hypothetical protein